MRDRRIALGVALGLALALLLPVAGARRPDSGRLLSDAGGPIREMVVQYVPDAAPIVLTAYREFLRQLPADRVVRVLVPDAAAFRDLAARVGPVACRLSPVVADHAITCWSRDRWLALAGTEGGVTLLSPAVEEGAAVWPAREGDARAGETLAGALAGVRCERSPLGFDGGDFVADADTVFVTPRVARRNRAVTEADRRDLARVLERRLGKRVVLLDTAPPHHAGMYLMFPGDRIAVVGDPTLAPGRPRRFEKGFEAVAARCREEGYRVVRIPVVPGEDGRSWRTWVNVILDEEEGRRIVYLPVYDSVPDLNEAAARVWRGLGYEVRRVNCSATWRSFGTLRCLVNVLSRTHP